MSLNTQSVSWPGWETVRQIGRGSFGSVYEIQRDIFGNIEKAAMKVISIPQNAGDIEEMYDNGYDKESITNTFKSHLKSIVEEYSMMRRLGDCPNIVACDDVRYIQHDDGIGWDIYIKMELLTPLLKSLQSSASEEMVVKLAKDICAALVSCKQHNIVHRDIKPQNLFCTSSGIYKLGDFGIAKTVEKTMGGTKIGTFNYMAPEVYHNRPYSSASDIYSLGMVLYWMLNEHRMPFLPLPPVKLSVGMEEMASNRRLSGESFGEPKNGRRELKAIVMKACAYRVEDRYSSASEMLMDLYKLDCVYADETVDAALPTDVSGQPFHTVLNESETVDIFATQRAKKQNDYPTVAGPNIHTEDASTVMARPGEPDTKRDDLNVLAAETYSDRRRETPAPKGNKKTLPVLVGIGAMLLAAVGLFFLFRHQHTWQDATCTMPRTCSECNETEGSELGHQIMAATCEASEQCTRCGETFAMALGHTWMDANCEMPETCSVCGAVAGDLAHQWETATYLQPMTCQLCGATQGSRLTPDSVYINELEFCDKYGKLWTMSMQSPSFKVHTDISSAEDYRDYKTQGHTKGPVYDYLGNQYIYGLHVDGDELANFYISYDIGGIYSTFSGVCSLSQEMITDYRSAPYSKYFEVYGDGELLFQSLEMSKGCEPQEFSVDISGVEILTILYPQTQGPSRIATIYDGKLS